MLALAALDFGRGPPGLSELRKRQTMQILGYVSDGNQVAVDIGGVESPDVGTVLAAAIKTHPIVAMWRIEPDVTDDDEEGEVTP